MDQEHQFRWWRIPVGRETSFPVKRKDFDAALEAVPVASLHEVLSWARNYGSPGEYFSAIGIPKPRDLHAHGFVPLASARWQGIDGASERNPAMTAHLTIYGVPSDRRKELRERMVSDGLPLLLRWLRSIEQGPETGRTVMRRLAVYLNGDRLDHTDT